MNCKECQQLYLLGLDNELSAQQRDSIEQHIQHCSGCQGEIEYLHNIRMRLENVEKLSPSQEVLQQIRDKARQNPTHPAFAPQAGLARFLYGLLAGGMIVGAILLWPKQYNPPVSTQQAVVKEEPVKEAPVSQEPAYTDANFSDTYKYTFSVTIAPESVNNSLKNLETQVMKMNLRIQ